MYKILNISYDQTHLQELFRKSKLEVSKKIFVEAQGDLLADAEIARLTDLFPFVAPVPNNVSLTQLRKDMRPYINEGNNGMIIFPVFGTLQYKFYSYPGTLVDGRPTLNPGDGYDVSKIPEIEATLTETILIDKPTLINGLVTHSYHIHNNINPVFLVLKVPLDQSWETVLAQLGE